jgi:NAD(P)-dependent dehydrogenase (short-subunit alcohol dehydrogenase family)
MLDRSASSLEGKVAVVTGGGGGIGRGISETFAAHGARVVVAERDPKRARETAEAIRKAGGQALECAVDVQERAQVAELLKATLGAYGGVDVLVNNAMAPTRAPFDESTAEQWDESMRINVRSLFLTAKAVMPSMTARGGGSIINVSSGAADPAVTGLPPGDLTYSVAKAALERFSSALADEVASANVAVNAMRPGAVKTEMAVSELGADYDWTGWGEPEAVVPAVVFLAAQRGDGFTGRVVDSTQYPTYWP